MIQIEHLFKRTRSGQILLDDIHMNIPEGEIFALVGRSGAGKSTLLRMLNRLECPSEGRVVVDGQDVSLCRKRYARLSTKRSDDFQHYHLLARKTVLEKRSLTSAHARL